MKKKGKILDKRKQIEGSFIIEIPYDAEFEEKLVKSKKKGNYTLERISYRFFKSKLLLYFYQSDNGKLGFAPDDIKFFQLKSD